MFPREKLAVFRNVTCGQWEFEQWSSDKLIRGAAVWQRVLSKLRMSIPSLSGRDKSLFKTKSCITSTKANETSGLTILTLGRTFLLKWDVKLHPIEVKNILKSSELACV